MSHSSAQILAAIDKLEPRIRRAFEASIISIRSRAQLAELEAALLAGDLIRAAVAAGLNPAAWNLITEATRTAFFGGGLFVQNDAPKSIGFLFDIHNRRAEAWLRDHSSQFITRINADQRLLIQEISRANLAAGRNPEKTALDIVGRDNPVTKRRVGGVVGLTPQQSGFVTNMRAELGDPAKMSNYFTRTRRDGRFDSIVHRAIADGKAVKVADIDRLTGRYADRLLQTRGNNIARTEALSAFNAGSDESVRQAVEQGFINAEEIVNTWDATGDRRTRDQHDSMDNQKRGFNEPFQAPDGTLLMHPGDSTLGAGADHIANCRCVPRREIDWIAQAA